MGVLEWIAEKQVDKKAKAGGSESTESDSPVGPLRRRGRSAISAQPQFEVSTDFSAICGCPEISWAVSEQPDTGRP